ncbi:Uncharacterised protein [Mycobacteroides abscessus subsp. abscessus]|nr:Uncharacterised protein [Mycobacteroides abscessus subsp. abscessus]
MVGWMLCGKADESYSLGNICSRKRPTGNQKLPAHRRYESSERAQKSALTCTISALNSQNLPAMKLNIEPRKYRLRSVTLTPDSPPIVRLRMHG